MGNTEVVGSGENLLGGSNMGNLGNMGTMGNLGNLGTLGNLGSLGNLVGSSEGTESRQNYWAPSFGNWPTHTVSKSSIYWQQINYLEITCGRCVLMFFFVS